MAARSGVSHDCSYPVVRNTDHTLGDLCWYLARSMVLTCPWELSNASQPTCTSTAEDVHHLYMYITCPDTGTLLDLLNIAINFNVCVCVCVLCVCVCMCVCVCVCVCMCVCVC